MSVLRRLVLFTCLFVTQALHAEGTPIHNSTVDGDAANRQQDALDRLRSSLHNAVNYLHEYFSYFQSMMSAIINETRIKAQLVPVTVTRKASALALDFKDNNNDNDNDDDDDDDAEGVMRIDGGEQHQPAGKPGAVEGKRRLETQEQRSVEERPEHAVIKKEKPEDRRMAEEERPEDQNRVDGAEKQAEQQLADAEEQMVEEVAEGENSTTTQQTFIDDDLLNKVILALMESDNFNAQLEDATTAVNNEVQSDEGPKSGAPEAQENRRVAKQNSAEVAHDGQTDREQEPTDNKLEERAKNETISRRFSDEEAETTTRIDDHSAFGANDGQENVETFTQKGQRSLQHVPGDENGTELAVYRLVATTERKPAADGATGKEEDVQATTSKQLEEASILALATDGNADINLGQIVNVPEKKQSVGPRQDANVPGAAENREENPANVDENVDPEGYVQQPVENRMALDPITKDTNVDDKPQPLEQNEAVVEQEAEKPAQEDEVVEDPEDDVENSEPLFRLHQLLRHENERNQAQGQQELEKLAGDDLQGEETAEDSAAADDNRKHFNKQLMDEQIEETTAISPAEWIGSTGTTKVYQTVYLQQQANYMLTSTPSSLPTGPTTCTTMMPDHRRNGHGVASSTQSTGNALDDHRQAPGNAEEMSQYLPGTSDGNAEAKHQAQFDEIQSSMNPANEPVANMGTGNDDAERTDTMRKSANVPALGFTVKPVAEYEIRASKQELKAGDKPGPTEEIRVVQSRCKKAAARAASGEEEQGDSCEEEEEEDDGGVSVDLQRARRMHLQEANSDISYGDATRDGDVLQEEEEEPEADDADGITAKAIVIEETGRNPQQGVQIKKVTETSDVLKFRKHNEPEENAQDTLPDRDHLGAKRPVEDTPGSGSNWDDANARKDSDLNSEIEEIIKGQSVDEPPYDKVQIVELGDEYNPVQRIEIQRSKKTKERMLTSVEKNLVKQLVNIILEVNKAKNLLATKRYVENSKLQRDPNKSPIRLERALKVQKV